jgi:hypothetical protein
MAEARKKRLEELGAELQGRDRTNPAYDETQRPMAAKPPGVGVFAPRPMGALGNASDAGQGRDRFGRRVRQPNVADLRETLGGPEDVA